jgi:hypothetical protein
MPGPKGLQFCAGRLFCMCLDVFVLCRWEAVKQLHACWLLQ